MLSHNPHLNNTNQRQNVITTLYMKNNQIETKIMKMEFKRI